MDTKSKIVTQGQQSARTALMFDLAFRGVSLPKEQAVQMLDLPYAEWTEELKAKLGPVAELVRAEDEKAASSSPTP